MEPTWNEIGNRTLSLLLPVGDLTKQYFLVVIA